MKPGFAHGAPSGTKGLNPLQSPRATAPAHIHTHGGQTTGLAETPPTPAVSLQVTEHTVHVVGENHCSFKDNSVEL